MEFLLNHSLEEEVKNVEEIVGMIKWFDNNGYKILLPDGVGTNSTKEEIERLTSGEFENNSIIFNTLKSRLEEEIENNKISIETFLSCFHYDIPEKVLVNFTSYGPGGMYTLPNSMAVMLNDSPTNVLKTVLHEMIHLIIEEPFVQKYNLSHWQKEAVVDTLCLDEQLKDIFVGYKRQPQTKNIKLDFLDKLEYKTLS